MDEPPRIPTKAELVERIEASRAALEAAIAPVPPDRLEAARDAGGWTVKDHLAHLGAWERSLVALLSGRSRAAAAGLDEEAYRAMDEQAANDHIYRTHAGRPLVEVLSEFGAAHDGVMDALRQLQDEDLARTYGSFQPGDPGEETGAPIVDWILGNTAGHFDEHRESIARLLAG